LDGRRAITLPDPLTGHERGKYSARRFPDAFYFALITVHWVSGLTEGTTMALPVLQKEMTEREQRELKTLLDRARIAHGRPLSNAETNSVKGIYR
jgi:hypothetical protein